MGWPEMWSLLEEPSCFHKYRGLYDVEIIMVVKISVVFASIAVPMLIDL